MSAFLLSYTHINVLITFAKAQRLVLPAPEAPKDISVSVDSYERALEFGRELIRENLRSLSFRYGDNPPCPARFTSTEQYLELYSFHPDSRGLVTRCGSAIAIIKATHCYDYQSCETPDYLKSWAAEVMRNIRDAACYLLPGYDEAPWGFTNPAPH